MKEYKRLTKKDRHEAKFDCIDQNKKRAILKRLWEIENQIENGTLIELPCKINDIVYEVCEKPNNNPFVKLPSEFFIVEHRMGDIKMTMIGEKPIFAMFTFNKEFGVMAWSGEHIGTQLFLTKSEAEARLRELKGEQK